MKKSEPKMILNLSVEDEELDNKIKLAMDEYVDNLVVKNLDEKVVKIVSRRIDKLLKADKWNSESKLQGKYLDDYVKEKTETVIEEAIQKNIKDIFAKKIAEII